VESRAVKVEASRDNGERLALLVPDVTNRWHPTHWSFGQLCRACRRAIILYAAASRAVGRINLQHGLLSHRAELLKTLETMTSRRASRRHRPGLWPHLGSRACRGRDRIAGNGIGDTMWKVPGVLDWATMDA